MSQASIEPSGNQSGSGYTAAVRSALAALATLFSGATAPASTGQPLAHQLWLDTATSTLKKRNGANTAWCRIAHADQFLGNSLAKRLVVQVTEGATGQASVTFDELSIEGTFLQAGSFTLSTTGTVGTVNNLDTGAWAAGWYAVYVIANEDGSLTGVLASTSTTAPTLPSGYTRKRRVGMVRCTGTGPVALRPVTQRNGECYHDGDIGASHQLNLGGGTAATFAAGVNISAAALVPPTSQRMHGTFILDCTANISATAEMFVRRTGSTATAGRRVARMKGATDQPSAHSDCTIELDSSQRFDYYVSLANTAGAVFVVGYVDPVL